MSNFNFFILDNNDLVVYIPFNIICLFVSSFTAQSTQWGYVERGQFT